MNNRKQCRRNYSRSLTLVTSPNCAKSSCNSSFVELHGKFPTNKTWLGGFGSTECPRYATGERENDRDTAETPESLVRDDAGELNAARESRLLIFRKEETVGARASLNDDKAT